jgi:FixJ family two-component response regulator
VTGTASPIVFIIDDDAGMRAAIQGLVKTVGLRAESFATPQDFFRRNPSGGPSCLVLDVRLPEIGGLDVQRKLADAGVKIPIIFITGHGDIPMSVKAMKSGAVEFLTKPFRHQDLLDAIQLALQRDRESQLEQEQIADLQKRYRTLTAREREVMGLVVSGMRNKEIASELGTSEITVKVHRGQVMHKMEAASVGELGRMAEKLKLPPTK